MHRAQSILFAVACALTCCLSANAQAIGAQPAIAMYGQPKYPPGFKHFDYVNPDAPKGGTLRRGTQGTFDSFNGFIPKGNAADGLDYLYDTLTVPSLDEPFTQYGLLAKSMELAPDRSWIIFHLRSEARFSDNTPVTADDVVYTFHLLTTQGSPQYAYYYSDVASVKALDTHTVKFTFKDGAHNRELPLIVGQLPVLPKHYWEKHNFTGNGFDVPVGSGPYTIASFKPGKQVVYQRRKNYWGKNLAVNKGRYNFDRIDYEYFLNEDVLLEAFKGGAYDYRLEYNSKNWATAYNIPAVKNGTIILEKIPNGMPAGIQGFIYNIRRPLFQDRVLRKALGYAFNFEWTNQHLFYGQYKRDRSYFENSAMEARGLPGKREQEILAPFRDQLPPEVFNKIYEPPVAPPNSRPRKNLVAAQNMLLKAGYTIRDNQLYTPDGKPVNFEILLFQAAFERILLPFANNLRALGVHASVRTVDQTQYVERLRHFDFDMIVSSYPQSNSPGNEQFNYWGSRAADHPDSRNLIGIKSPVVDKLIKGIVQAQSREDLVAHCRALDRVLQWGYYMIPNWYLNYFRVAYRNTLAHPRTIPPNGIDIDAWWSKEAGQP